MKHPTTQFLTPIAAIGLLVCMGTSLGAQESGFNEQADDFLSRKIAPKSTETHSSGWSLFGQSPSGYPAKKMAATIVLAISISLLAICLLRMKPGQRRGGLPDDVVSMLGQIPFGPNQRLQLVRLGSKLLLITSSQNGSHTLGEITDPEEVLQIESICRNGKFDTIGQTLRNRAQAAAHTTRTRPSASMASRTLLEA